MKDLSSSKKLMQWIGADEEDLLIAYSKELADKTTNLLASLDEMVASPEQAKAVNKAAKLMARLSVDMKTIHREIFP